MGVFAHTHIIIMPGLMQWVASNNHHLVSEAIYCRYGACSLKSVTTTLGLLFSWLHMQCTALHSSYHIGEPSFIPKICTPIDIIPYSTVRYNTYGTPALCI